MTKDNDLVKRLRAVDHLSVEDCFTQSPLYGDAADCIEALEAERDLATSALMHLERCAQVVSERGAVTGPQWTRLTVAILKAREAMSKLPTPSPINEPRLVQSAPPLQN